MGKNKKACLHDLQTSLFTFWAAGALPLHLWGAKTQSETLLL
jgi:hypothetical protein